MGRLHAGTTRYDGSTSEGWADYVCGHCGTTVSGAVVASFKDGYCLWLLCPSCENASVSVGGDIFPGVMFGPDISGLPDEVREAYDESRRCMSVDAFSAAELLCRKLLMHVAVDKGAKEGDAFAAYLTYLQQQGYITPR